MTFFPSNDYHTFGSRVLNSAVNKLLSKEGFSFAAKLNTPSYSYLFPSFRINAYGVEVPNPRFQRRLDPLQEH